MKSDPSGFMVEYDNLVWNAGVSESAVVGFAWFEVPWVLLMMLWNADVECGVDNSAV